MVLETHGKDRKLSQIVMKTQAILREKFREVQQSKGISKSTSSLDSYTKDERNDSLGRKDINFEELVSKGLKRVYDLIEKPIDRLSEDELQKRISEIKVGFLSLKFSILLGVFGFCVGELIVMTRTLFPYNISSNSEATPESIHFFKHQECMSFTQNPTSFKENSISTDSTAHSQRPV